LTTVSSADFTPVDRIIKLPDRSGEGPGTAVSALHISFADEDNANSLIGGTVSIIIQRPESVNIIGYRVYYYGNQGIVKPVMRGLGYNDWIVEVNATGFDVSAVIPNGTIVPGVSRLAVFAFNADGVGATGASCVLNDLGVYAVPGEVPVTAVIITVVVGFGLCCCFFTLWIIYRQLTMTTEEEDAAELAFEEEKIEEAAVPDQFRWLEVGENVEYWSFHREKFMPGSITEAQENGLYTVRLAFGDGSQKMDKVPGSRLRRCFGHGDPVEVLLPDGKGGAGMWVGGGYVEGHPNAALYRVSFPPWSGRPPIISVPARHVRTCYKFNDQVLVPWSGALRLALVLEAVQPTGIHHFPAQTLKVRMATWDKNQHAKDIKKSHNFSSAAVKRVEQGGDQPNAPNPTQNPASSESGAAPLALTNGSRSNTEPEATPPSFTNGSRPSAEPEVVNPSQV